MIVVIDNYDSFTYNLVQYLEELGTRTVVFRNDRITIAELQHLQPHGIVISPGPCTPNEAGISLAAIRHMADYCPILGVCLGHQAIGQVFGATVTRAPRPVHGKTSPIYHHGEGVLTGLPNPFPAARYHSLVLQPEALPHCLKVSAVTGDGIIMGVRHRQLPVEGVQFHPESILTRGGKQILANFLERCGIAAVPGVVPAREAGR